MINIFNIVIYLIVLMNMAFAAPIPFDTATWMRDLKPLIGDRPLTKLVIPATHDSASNLITTQNPDLAIAKGAEISQIANVALAVVAPWARAQYLSIYEQLMAGARVLDLRIAWRNQKKFAGIFSDGTKDFLGREQSEGVQGPKGLQTTYYKNFWTHHSAYSEKLDSVFYQIRRFIDEHPSEILILKFAEFLNMEEKQYDDLIHRIKQAFGYDIAYTATPNDTINTLNALGKRIIISLSDRNKAMQANFWGPDQFCSGTWANKQKFEDLFAFLKNRVPKRLSNDISCEHKLWNTSLELTPDNDLITNSLNIFNPKRIQNLSMLDETIDKNRVLNWLEMDKINPNLVSSDFFSKDFGAKIIKLNLLH